MRLGQSSPRPFAPIHARSRGCRSGASAMRLRGIPAGWRYVTSTPKALDRFPLRTRPRNDPPGAPAGEAPRPRGGRAAHAPRGTAADGHAAKYASRPALYVTTARAADADQRDPAPARRRHVRKCAGVCVSAPGRPYGARSRFLRVRARARGLPGQPRGGTVFEHDGDRSASGTRPAGKQHAARSKRRPGRPACRSFASGRTGAADP